MKYELTNETILFGGCMVVARIRALRHIRLHNGTEIQPGQLGGYVHSMYNLSQEGNCWIADDAVVAEKARVQDDAIVAGNCLMTGQARAQDCAIVRDNARLWHNAVVCDNATVIGNAMVSGSSKICGATMLKDRVFVSGVSTVSGTGILEGDAMIRHQTIRASLKRIGATEHLTD